MAKRVTHTHIHYHQHWLTGKPIEHTHEHSHTGLLEGTYGAGSYHRAHGKGQIAEHLRDTQAGTSG